METLVQGVGAGPVLVPADAGGVGVEPRSLEVEPVPVIADEAFLLDAAALVDQRAVEAVQTLLGGPVHLAYAEAVVAARGEHPLLLVQDPHGAGP